MITGDHISTSRVREDVILAEQIAAEMNVHAVDDAERVRVGKELFSLRLWPSLGHITITRVEDQRGRAHLRWAPTFRGMLALCMRNAELAYIEPVLVLEGDEFSYEDGVVHHKYNPLDDREATAENIRGGYVRIVYRDNRPVRYHFVSRAKILKNRACAKRSRTWDDWFQEMALKTLIRDAFARGALPMTAEMHVVAEAIKAEDEYLGNDPEGPAMKGYHQQIEAAGSVKELQAVLKQIIADNSLPSDIKSKLRKQCAAKHEAMTKDVPQDVEAAEEVLAEMTDPEEVLKYGKWLVAMDAPTDVIELARQRYRALTRQGDVV